MRRGGIHWAMRAGGSRWTVGSGFAAGRIGKLRGVNEGKRARDDLPGCADDSRRAGRIDREARHRIHLLCFARRRDGNAINSRAKYRRHDGENKGAYIAADCGRFWNFESGAGTNCGAIRRSDRGGQRGGKSNRDAREEPGTEFEGKCFYEGISGRCESALGWKNEGG